MYMDVGHNFGAGPGRLFITIALPGALPFIMTGIKLGAGMGLILIAIAEMIGAQSGLGYMIWNAWQILSVNTMYVGLITIAVLGFALTLILNEVERFLIPRPRGPLTVPRAHLRPTTVDVVQSAHVRVRYDDGHDDYDHSPRRG